MIMSVLLCKQQYKVKCSSSGESDNGTKINNEWPLSYPELINDL